SKAPFRPAKVRRLTAVPGRQHKNPDYNRAMGRPSLSCQAHRCSFHPDRQDPYLRLGCVTIYVRDQDRSLHFYLHQLGFSLAFDTFRPSGERWLAVSPPDGTAVLTLVSPKPES